MVLGKIFHIRLSINHYMAHQILVVQKLILSIGDHIPQKKKAKNVMSHIQTRFFRLLVLLRKTPNTLQKVFIFFVPIQNFNEFLGRMISYIKNMAYQRMKSLYRIHDPSNGAEQRVRRFFLKRPESKPTIYAYEENKSTI